MEETIQEIQNAVWKAYKNFLSTMDVRQFTADCADLVRKYKAGSVEGHFCSNLCITYVPIVRELKRITCEKAGE